MIFVRNPKEVQKIAELERLVGELTYERRNEEKGDPLHVQRLTL